MDDHETYDVVVCGGGLAGLSLSRQIKLKHPRVSLIVIDRLSRPLPVATLKVGESTVEVGAYYYAQILGLNQYLRQEHYRKLGLRYFFPTSNQGFHSRPEFGLSEFPEGDSFQLDRGILENDLREMISASGLVIMEGYKVQDILLSEQDGLHEVTCVPSDGGRPELIKGRWVIDAMGRRRYLQKKLGLTTSSGQTMSAAWFRVDGRLDITSSVPRSKADWHSRVRNQDRYFSTNHLMGNGYWIWLIPLSSGNTSVGIVVNESMHRFEEFNTIERALHWIRCREPNLHDLLASQEFLDFKTMRNYSYSSRRVLSKSRWATLGDAGVFSDPFYSIGSDLIGFLNSAVADVVKKDLDAEPWHDDADYYNSFVIALNDSLAYNTQLAYPFFGNAVVMAGKLLWDLASGWAIVTPQIVDLSFIDRDSRSVIKRTTAGYIQLGLRMQKLFLSWAALSPGQLTFDYIDYLTIPFLGSLRARSLYDRDTHQALEVKIQMNMRTLEELALALFLIAIEDVKPDWMPHLEQIEWFNPLAVGLDEEKWEPEGLLRPDSSPRDFKEIWKQIRNKLRVRDSRNSKQNGARLMHEDARGS